MTAHCGLDHAPGTALISSRGANGGDDRCRTLQADPEPEGRSAPPTGRGRSRRRGIAGAAALLVTAGTLAACGGDGGGPSTLTWYINPDSGGQAEIAPRCTEEAGGRVHDRDLDPAARRAARSASSSIRRLAADDSSIDIMSLDPPFIPEFAEAGFLAPVPEDVAERVTEDVVQSAIDGSTWNDELVAVPFWANTQLLWYRKSVAEAAGLDMTQPVTWEQIVEAAESQDKLVGAQGTRAESLTVWFNALIESAGGSIIAENADDPEDITLGLDSAGGRAGGRDHARRWPTPAPAGAAFSTATRTPRRPGFESEDGGFMVNCPFVWPRALSAVEAGTLDQSVPDDYGGAIYPRVDEDSRAAPPYGGINLGIGAFSEYAELAYEAAECIVADENQALYFLDHGNPASKDVGLRRPGGPGGVPAWPRSSGSRWSWPRRGRRRRTTTRSPSASSATYHPPGSVDPATTGAAGRPT